MLKQELYPRDMTDPMWHTPRQRLYERALRGRWHLFLVSPEPYCQRLSNGLGEGFRSKSQTFKLAKRLQATIERLDRTTATSAPERLAAHRALVAWCYRAMERCDDSYGVIGELGTDALLTYASVDYEPTGIAGEAWCEDLCELLAWENWGLLLRAETRPFAQLRGELAEHAEQFMLTLADELRAHRLRYEADQTIANVAYLHIAAGRLTLCAGRATARLRPLDADRRARPGRDQARLARHRSRGVHRRRPARPPARLPAQTAHRADRHATSPEPSYLTVTRRPTAKSSAGLTTSQVTSLRAQPTPARMPGQAAGAPE